MLQEIDTDVITLTPEAANAIKNIIDEKKLEGYFLRIFVAGSSCCSTQFGMALDNKVGDKDAKLVSNGIEILVDEMSIEYLRGGKIDFVNDPLHGQGFIVDSPSAQKESGSCACGGHNHESSHEHGETCACGGNCDCNN